MLLISYSTLCMLDNFSFFCCRLLTVFNVKKKHSGKILEYQRVWIKIRTDITPDLVQTVCKGTQQAEITNVHKKSPSSRKEVKLKTHMSKPAR